jgi:hypothetical protein
MKKKSFPSFNLAGGLLLHHREDSLQNVDEVAHRSARRHRETAKNTGSPYLATPRDGWGLQ